MSGTPGPQVNADVLALQLERVLTKLPTLFDKDDTFYAKLKKKKTEVVSTRDMRVPLKIRPGGNFGHFNPAGGSLGSGSGAEYEKAIVNTVDFRHAVQWQLEVEWATDDRRKAVHNSVNTLIADAMPDFRKHCDNAVIGSDGRGQLATVAAVDAGAGPGSSDLLTLNDDHGAKLLRYNDKVSVTDSGRTAFRQYATTTDLQDVPVFYIDQDAKQIGLVASGTTFETGIIAGDICIIEGLGLGSVTDSILGVLYHQNAASTGTWLQLDRADNPEIRCNAVDANQAGLALPFPRLAINKIGNRLGISEGKNLVAWIHPCQTQAYEELGQLVSIINKTAKEEGLDLYFNRNMQLAGAPVQEHFSWDKTRIDFINMASWGRAEMKRAGFHTVGGTRIFEVRDSNGNVMAAQQFFLTSSMQTYTDNPASGSYVENLKIPAGY